MVELFWTLITRLTRLALLLLKFLNFVSSQNLHNRKESCFGQKQNGMTSVTRLFVTKHATKCLTHEKGPHRRSDMSRGNSTFRSRESLHYWQSPFRASVCPSLVMGICRTKQLSSSLLFNVTEIMVFNLTTCQQKP